MMLKIRLVIIVFISCFTIAFGTSKDTSYNLVQIDSIIKKVDIYKVKFEYTKALNCILKLKEFYDQNKDFDGLVFCNIKLGEVNRHAAQYKNTNTYLLEAEKLIKTHKQKITEKTLIYYYNRKAAISSEYFNEPDSTLYYSKKALKLAEKSNNALMQLTSLSEIGFAYENLNNLSLAKYYYIKANNITNETINNEVKCDILVNLARVYTKLRELDKALQVCEDGINLIDGENNIFQKLLFYDNITNIYELLGDNKKALENLKLRMKFTEFYYKQSELNKFQEINEKYQLLEKNNEILRTKEKVERAKKNEIYLSSILFLFLVGIISLIYYSRKLKNTSKKLNSLYKENDFLLQEANHRINNNLQLIIILISDEVKKLNNPESLSVKKILSKVESIATLHRQLYQNKNKSKIDIAVYLNNIKSNFDELFEEKQIKVVVNVQEQLVGIDQGMYLGLLLTELFINSLKHAFNKQFDKKIIVNITSINNNYLFEYQDNGIGSFGKNIQPKLVDKLCKQLKVNYTINTKNGFYFSFNKLK